MPRALPLILTLLLAHRCLSAVACAQALHTTSDIHPTAQLLKLVSPEQWSFQIGERDTSVAGSRIVRWGSWPGLRDEQGVWLSDGSWLCGDVELEPERLTVTSDWLQSISLPLQSVRGVVLSPPRTLTGWLELQSQMLAASGEADLLWLASGRKLSGIVRWPAPTGEQAGRELEVDVSGQPLKLTLDEIEAIVFSPTLLGPIPPHPTAMQIGLSGGSLLWVTQLAPDISSVELTLSGAIQLTSLDGPRQFCKAITYLVGDKTTVATARLQFLSELPVASYRHVADSTLTWELGINHDCYGGALHTRQGIFPWGLATHSSSQVAYRWDGSPGRLLAEVTFAAQPPQASAGLGSVNCQILLARGGQLEAVQRFSLTRSAATAAEAVHFVDVELSQALLLVLVTDKADLGQYGDQLLWLDARITTPEP